MTWLATLVPLHCVIIGTALQTKKHTQEAGRMKAEEVVVVAAGGEAAALEPAGSKTTAWQCG